MQNPLKILLFTNQPKSVNRVRQAVAVNPSSPVWWTLLFLMVIASSSMALTHLIQPKTIMVSGWNYLVASVMLMIVQILSILFMNGMATWAVNRQQRKSWGVSLPGEPRILGFRPGIWVGAATSYAVCIGMILLEVCAALLLTAWHKQIVSTMSTVVGVMSLLYFSYAVAYFYGIPKRLFVFWYVVLPVVLISIVGIIAAIMMGQYRNYENQKAQQKVDHFAVPSKTTRAPSTATTFQSRETKPVQPSSTLSVAVRKADAHCASGFPLAAPWLPSGTVSATVAGFVSRTQALRYVMENQQNLHGRMESRYLSNQRVLVHPYGFPSSDTELALVPVGTQVFIGETVQVASFHASHRLSCTYIPNLIVRPTVTGSSPE